MLFTYSKTTVLDCLKPLTLSAVGNDDTMLRNKFVVVCKCPGAGTLLTVKCPAPGTHREQMPGVCPGGGMLAVGVDLHIRGSAFFPFKYFIQIPYLQPKVKGKLPLIVIVIVAISNEGVIYFRYA